MNDYSNLSIVIPYRLSNDPIRERIFDWNLRRYSTLMPGAEVILGSMNSGNTLFCRSEALNNGVRKSKRKYIALADSDIFVPVSAFDAGIEALNGFPWIIPYQIYHELDKVSSSRVLNSSPEETRVGLYGFSVAGSYPNSNASLILLERDTYWDSGGFDERFKGWAPEDQSWAAAITTLCGPPKRIDTSDLYHLWHPVNPSAQVGNSRYEYSVSLWDKYKEANCNRKMMQELVETTKPQLMLRKKDQLILNKSKGPLAMLICDVWDGHWCKATTRRLSKLAHKINNAADSVRKNGGIIIHAPAGAIDFYTDHPARLNVHSLHQFQLSELRRDTLPYWDVYDTCKCKTSCTKLDYGFFRQQHPVIKIESRDYISDDIQEIYNVLLSNHSELLLMTGVHTDVCLLNRPFGLRGMYKVGVECALVRDLTEAFDPRNTEQTIVMIEKYLFGSIDSSQLGDPI